MLFSSSVSVASAPSIYMLNSSSRGPAVKQLQRNLNARLEQLGMLSHISVEIDGIFDSDTLLAVKYLQSASGLPVNGRVCESTRRFIERGFPALRTLKLGSTGTQVRAVQRTLNAAQIEVVADSHFGEFTELGVKRYQQSLNLADSGVVDTPTWENIVRSRLKSVPCIALLPNPYSIGQLVGFREVAKEATEHSTKEAATNGKL